MKIIEEYKGKHYFCAGVSRQGSGGEPLPLFSIGSKKYYISKTTINSVEISEIGGGVAVVGSQDEICKRILNKINNS